MGYLTGGVNLLTAKEDLEEDTMNTNTGEIVDWEKFISLPDAEKEPFVALTDELYGKLKGMNRQQRRAYYRRHKNEFPGGKWQAIEQAGKEEG